MNPTVEAFTRCFGKIDEPFDEDTWLKYLGLFASGWEEAKQTEGQIEAVLQAATRLIENEYITHNVKKGYALVFEQHLICLALAVNNLDVQPPSAAEE